jgi:hypothetical protein
MDDAVEVGGAFAPLAPAELATAIVANTEDRAPGATAFRVVLPAPLPVPDPLPRWKPRRRLAGVWTYRDAAGAPLFAVVRFDALDADGRPVLGANGKPTKETPALVCGETAGGKPHWRWSHPPAPRPLYGLDRLAARPGAPVLVVEGEKTADTAALLFPDHVAVTWQGGSGAVDKADRSALAGREVVACEKAPNRDPAGIQSTALIIHRKVARGWGPDRRRSGPHLFANSGHEIRLLQSLSGGVPVWRLFTVRRWTTEVTFAEVRRHLGVETQRQWSDRAIARTTPVLLGLYSLVALWANELQRGSAILPRAAAWYAKPAPTFSDALAAVRRTLWADAASCTSRADRNAAKVPRSVLDRLTDLACYAA